MFGISRKTKVDNKSERIKELEKTNAYYKKLIAKLKIEVKALEDKMDAHAEDLIELKRRVIENNEKYKRAKKQLVAENRLLLRCYKELERQCRALERKMNREFVKKEKPSPSLMGRIRAIRDKILDFIS